MKNYLFVLLAIVAVAVFFRFWQLDSIPPGLYPDEAINGNQAISNPGKIFYPENNGREGFFINLLYLSFSLFGISIWSLKFVSALFGVLTVLGVYLLTKEIFQTTNYKLQTTNYIALLSAFFLSVSFWHVNFSRIAFRAILVPFCLVFLFYFLFRGFRTQKISNFIIGGIFFGLGFNTYIAFRIAVIPVLIVLIFWWLIYRKQNLQKKFFRFTIYFLLFTIIVALPLGVYFLKNPQDFISRAGGVSIFTHKTPIKAFSQSLIKHLGMFNFSGDGNWRHNIAGKPVLFWPVGILFLIGLIFCLWKILQVFKHKNLSFVIGYLSLFLWWFFMLLPGILTIEGIPHSLRTIGAIPPTFILAAFGAFFIYSKIKKFISLKSEGLTKIGLMFCLLILTASFVFSQYLRYFVVWGKNPETKNAFSSDYVEIGNYLNSLPPETKKYVIVNQGGVLVKGIPMPSQTIEFIERTKFKKPQAFYLLPKDIDKIKMEKETVIVPMRYDEDLVYQLLLKFPSAKIYEIF
ncbi:glycosyltransferase family 39 protein [bacterium]|nr:glycosyltransferase family 39 protein [bacterium]